MGFWRKAALAAAGAAVALPLLQRLLAQPAAKNRAVGDLAAPIRVETIPTVSGLVFETLVVGRPAPGTPSVLLIHGFPDVPHTFEHQLRALHAAGYHAVAPHLRGYRPEAQPADGDYLLPTIADDVMELLDILGVDRVHVVGHDWGAAIALCVAASYEARVRSLTIVAVPHQYREILADVPSQLLNMWYMGLFILLPGVAELWLQQGDWAGIETLYRRWSPTWSPPADHMARVKNAFEAPGVMMAALEYYRLNLAKAPLHLQGKRAELARFERLAAAHINPPTLAITGAVDGCCRTEMFDHRHHKFSSIRVERVPNAGHFVQIEVPDRFNELLLAHLAKHSSRD